MSTVLAIIALVFIVLALFSYYRFWRGTKQLKVGSTISSEYVESGIKEIKIGSMFLVIGCVFEVIAILIKI